MERITRKQFAEMLNNNSSILMGSVFRWTDEKCKRAMENIRNINEKAERRSVSENHSNYIIFNNGSRLDFDQDGKKEYFKYKSENGIQFLIQRTAVFDTFDNVENLNYIVYAIVESESNAERDFCGVEISGKEEKESLCRWLKSNGYYYETSGNYENYHLEIRCSEKEKTIINRKISEIYARKNY